MKTLNRIVTEIFIILLCLKLFSLTESVMYLVFIFFSVIFIAMSIIYREEQ